jgi:hypothetical protein
MSMSTTRAFASLALLLIGSFQPEAAEARTAERLLAHNTLANTTYVSVALDDDGNGPYNTTARLEGDELKGTTHSIGRDFVALWTARRMP